MYKGMHFNEEGINKRYDLKRRKIYSPLSPQNMVRTLRKTYLSSLTSSSKGCTSSTFSLSITTSSWSWRKGGDLRLLLFFQELLIDNDCLFHKLPHLEAAVSIDNVLHDYVTQQFSKLQCPQGCSVA